MSRPTLATKKTSLLYANAINAHTCAIKDLSARAYSELCATDKLKGTPISDCYASHTMCKEFQEIMPEIIREGVVEKLKRSPVNGAILDEVGQLQPSLVHGDRRKVHRPGHLGSQGCVSGPLPTRRS